MKINYTNPFLTPPLEVKCIVNEYDYNYENNFK